MKRIGFIDYYIDEWHANNYPAMIRKAALGKDFEVTLAWEETTPAGKKSIDAWCGEQGVKLARSIEQVVEECDCIVVLSPDNPEHHERLSDLPLKSGKPVYVDKTFSPTRAEAIRMFEKAAAYSTPMMSSSALRFGTGLQKARGGLLRDENVNFVATSGPGRFDNYSVHQIEMLVMLLGIGAQRVMQCGNKYASSMIIDYPDGRRGSILLAADLPFRVQCNYGEGRGMEINEMGDFFDRFIDAMLVFFMNGVSPINNEETIEIMALYETGIKALTSPDTWHKL